MAETMPSTWSTRGHSSKASGHPSGASACRVQQGGTGRGMVCAAKPYLRSDASSAAAYRPHAPQPAATLLRAPFLIYAPPATGCRLALQGKMPIRLHAAMGPNGILATPLPTDTRRLHFPPLPTRRRAHTIASMATTATRVLHAPRAPAPPRGSAEGSAEDRVGTTPVTGCAHSPALPYRTLSLPGGQTTWTTARFSATRLAFTPRQARGRAWHVTNLGRVPWGSTESPARPPQTRNVLHARSTSRLGVGSTRGQARWTMTRDHAHSHVTLATFFSTSRAAKINLNALNASTRLAIHISHPITYGPPMGLLEHYHAPMRVPTKAFPSRHAQAASCQLPPPPLPRPSPPLPRHP